MLSDPSVREGYVQGAVARGMEAAGSNKSGAMAGFMGMNMGAQAEGGFVAAASQSNQKAMEQQARQQAEAAAQQGSWSCSCGAKCTGNFCLQCGKPKPENNTWKCTCGAQCTGNFCPECGAKRPAGVQCPKCGWKSETPAKFCPECGEKL